MQHYSRAARAEHGLQTHGNAETLHKGNQHRQITRVLRYLAPPGLAFFLGHAFHIRQHHLQQLHDDGRGDVRHDAERKHGHIGKAAAGKQIEHAQQRVGHVVEKGFQSFSVHTGHGNVHADAIAAQKQKGPSQPFDQRGLTGQIVDRCCHELLVAFVRQTADGKAPPGPADGGITVTRPQERLPIRTLHRPRCGSFPQRQR